MESVCMSLYGERILNNLSLTVHKKEIVCLYGADSIESAAIASLLTGTGRKEYGNVYLNDRLFSPSAPLPAGGGGIYVIDETNHFLPNLTIAENIVLGREKRFVHSRKAAPAEALPALQQAGEKAPSPSRTASSCSLMELSLAELAKAFYLRPSLLLFRQCALFDEKNTAEILAPVLRRLVNSGTSVICTSQNMNAALLLADTIGFLYHGMCLGMFGRHEFYTPRFLQTRTAVERVPAEGPPALPHSEGMGRTLEIRSLSGSSFADFSVTVRSGEIIGIFSWNRSALDELINILGGALRPESGDVFRDGKLLRYRSPHGALKAGIAMSSPAVHDLYIEDLQLSDNMLLPAFSRLSHSGIRSRKRERILKEHLAKQARMPSAAAGKNGLFHPDARNEDLRRYTRERAILARGMASNPDVLLLGEPLAGMDYETELDTISFLRERAGEGTIILITSTDERMLRQICSRTIRLETVASDINISKE